MQDLRDVLREQILVFLGEAGDVVDDVAAVVLDLELGSFKLACLLIMRVLDLLQVDLMELSK